MIGSRIIYTLFISIQYFSRFWRLALLRPDPGRSTQEETNTKPPVFGFTAFFHFQSTTKIITRARTFNIIETIQHDLAHDKPRIKTRIGARFGAQQTAEKKKTRIGARFGARETLKKSTHWSTIWCTTKETIYWTSGSDWFHMWLKQFFSERKIWCSKWWYLWCFFYLNLY